MFTFLLSKRGKQTFLALRVGRYRVFDQTETLFREPYSYPATVFGVRLSRNEFSLL